MERALGAQRDHLILLVAKDLHKKQPWYHGKITRDEADKIMTEAGHEDGKFLLVFKGIYVLISRSNFIVTTCVLCNQIRIKQKLSNIQHAYTEEDQ